MGDASDLWINRSRLKTSSLLAVQFRVHRMPTAVVARSTTVRPVSNRDRSHASFRMSRPARSSFFRTLELAVSAFRKSSSRSG